MNLCFLFLFYKETIIINNYYYKSLNQFLVERQKAMPWLHFWIFQARRISLGHLRRAVLPGVGVGVVADRKNQEPERGLHVLKTQLSPPLTAQTLLL